MSMKISEALAQESETERRGPRCGVAVLRARLDAEDLADVDRLLAEVHTGERTAASLARILTRAGYPFTSNRLTYHVRGECRCPKT